MTYIDRTCFRCEPSNDSAALIGEECVAEDEKIDAEKIAWIVEDIVIKRDREGSPYAERNDFSL